MNEISSVFYDRKVLEIKEEKRKNIKERKVTQSIYLYLCLGHLYDCFGA